MALPLYKQPTPQKQESDVAPLEKRLSVLKNERQSWVEHWRDLSTYILPRRSRFLNQDVNKGSKRNSRIINGRATRAIRILAAGMQSGITSPARAWFRLVLPDPDLTEYGPVKSWLARSEFVLRMMFARSNIYNCLHNVYGDLGCFGTSALHVDEDAEDTLRGYVFPVGQYCLANSDRLQVDTTFRELRFTAGQLVQRFGEESCSQRVKELCRRDGRDTWLDVVHVVQPNTAYQHGRAGPRGMRWKSCWFEAVGHEGRYLREAGFEEFPICAPRWNVTGEDIYGDSPCMDALGDAKALQTYELAKAKAVAKIVDPPMQGPMGLMNQRVSLLPGDFTAVPGMGGSVVQPAVVIPPAAIGVVTESIREVESRLMEELYADLWVMLQRRDEEGATPDMTATEINERHEEKMTILGPVLERLEDELLDPLIDRAFAIAARRGFIPPAPPEVQGMEMKPEYISPMAQAQKMLGTVASERAAAFAGNVAAVKPDVIDVLDLDEVVRDYADKVGLKPELIRTPEALAALREERAAQQQQMQQAQAAVTAAQGAKTLSETDMEGDNALTRLVGTLGGPAGAVA